MKPVDKKSSIYVDSGKENNEKGPKFNIGSHVKISKYKSILTKYYVSDWPDEVFVIKEVKNTVALIYVIIDHNSKKIVGTCYWKELQKTNQKEFRVEKVIKRKGGKLYLNWRG